MERTLPGRLPLDVRDALCLPAQHAASGLCSVLPLHRIPSQCLVFPSQPVPNW